MNLVQMVKNAAMISPNKIFAVFNKKKITFKEFDKRTRLAGAGFLALNIKKGDKIALLLHNSIDFLEAYFGGIAAGAIIVPINIFLKFEEVQYILNDCKVKALVTSSDFEKVIEGINPISVPALENVIAIDKLKHSKHILFESLFADNKIQEVKISQEDVAVIIYTSGTTGNSKGAMLSHKNLITDVENCIDIIEVTDKDIFMSFLPMFHSYSFAANIMIPLYCRCKLVILKSVQPFALVIKSLLWHRVSVFIAIPQIYSVLAERKLPFWFHWLNPMRACISGGASLPVESFYRFEKTFNKPLIEGYGLSEASPICSINPLSGKRKPGSIGPPINNVEIKIVDDNGKEVHRGQTGELIVKGDNVMIGYYNNPEATKEAIKDGWLYTGDMGMKDEDGYIFIQDRKKDLIIVNGMNLYPREVEELLYKHPAVADVAVVGDTDKIHGEIPIAVIRLKEGIKADENEIKKYCKEHIANFKVPHRIEFWQELPRNATGKILKKDIKKRLGTVHSN